MGWAQFAGVLGIVGAAAFLLAFTLSREMVAGRKAPLDTGTAVPSFVGPSVLDGFPAIPVGIREQSGPSELALFQGGLHVFPTRRRAGGARSAAGRGSIARRRRRGRGLAGGLGGSRRSALRLRNPERTSHRVGASRRAADWGRHRRSDGPRIAALAALAWELRRWRKPRVSSSPALRVLG